VLGDGMTTVQMDEQRYYAETIRVRPKTETRLTESIVEARKGKRTQLMVLAAVKWCKGDYRLYKSEKDYADFQRLYSYKQEDDATVVRLEPADLSIALRDDEKSHKEFTRVIDYLDEHFFSFYILHQVAEVDPFPRSPDVTIPFSVRLAKALGRPVRRKVNEYILKIDFPTTHRTKRIARLQQMLAAPPKADLERSSLPESSTTAVKAVSSGSSSSSSSSSGESSSLLEKSVLGSGSPRSPRRSGSSPKGTLASVSEDEEEEEENGNAKSESSEKSGSPVVIGYRLPKKTTRRASSIETKPNLKGKINK
jgi:hypothetical protein